MGFAIFSTAALDKAILYGLWFEQNPVAPDANTASLGGVFTTKGIVSGLHTGELFRIRAYGVWSRGAYSNTNYVKLVATIPSDCAPASQQTLTFGLNAFKMDAAFPYLKCSVEGVKKITVRAYDESNALLAEISNNLVVSNSQEQCTRYSNDFSYAGVSSLFETGKWVAKTEAGYYILLASASAGPQGNWKGNFMVVDFNKKVLTTATLYSCQEFEDKNLGVKFKPLAVFPAGNAVISIARTGAKACVDSDGNLPFAEQFGVRGTCKDTMLHTDYTFGTNKIVEYYCKDELFCKSEVVDCVNKGFDKAEDGRCVKTTTPGTGGAGCYQLSNEFEFKDRMTLMTPPVQKNGVSIRLIGFSFTAATFQATYGSTKTAPFTVEEGRTYEVHQGIVIRVCDVVGTPGSTTIYASVGFSLAGATVTPTPTPTITPTPQSKTLRVFVSEADGSFVREATVDLSLPSGRQVDSKKTDFEGVVNFYPLDAGDYVLKVSKGGYYDATRKVAVSATEAITTVFISLQKKSETAPSTHWMRAYIEKGSLEIKNGRGVLTIHGKGIITVNDLSENKDMVVHVAGYGGGAVNTDGSRTYTGDGLLAARGSKVDVKASGEKANFYAQGTGQVKLEGRGIYEVGTGKDKSPWTGKPITNFGVTLNGQGWIKAYGSGSISASGAKGAFVITGSGELTVTDNAGDSQRIVTGFGKIETINANTKRYLGYGTVFFRGSNFDFSASGSAIDFYGKGSAKTFIMSGDGFYNAGSDLNLPQITKCSDTDSEYYNTIAPLKAGTCTDKTGSYSDISIDSTKIEEYYCNPPFGADFSTKVCSKTIVDCKTYGSEYYAKDGACVKQSVFCSDSDGEETNYFEIQGTCKDNTGTYYDYKVDSNSIKEYYCKPFISNGVLQPAKCTGVVEDCKQYGNYEAGAGKCVKKETQEEGQNYHAVCGGFSKVKCLGSSDVQKVVSNKPVSVSIMLSNDFGYTQSVTIGGKTATCKANPVNGVAVASSTTSGNTIPPKTVFTCYAGGLYIVDGGYLNVIVKYLASSTTSTAVSPSVLATDYGYIKFTLETTLPSASGPGTPPSASGPVIPSQAGFSKLAPLDYSTTQATTLMLSQVHVVWKNAAGQNINIISAKIGDRTAYCSPRENVAQNAQFGCLAVGVAFSKGASILVTVTYSSGGTQYTEAGYVTGK